MRFKTKGLLRALIKPKMSRLLLL